MDEESSEGVTPLWRKFSHHLKLRSRAEFLVILAIVAYLRVDRSELGYAIPLTKFIHSGFIVLVVIFVMVVCDYEFGGMMVM